MNTQMMLALGALVLLSLVIINVNKTSVYTEDAMYDSSFGILANSLGASVIEEASHKHFDENTDTIYVNNLVNLTAIGALGPDAGETDVTKYDDFDDFNGYTRIDNSMPSAVFKISAAVKYVDPLYPDQSITKTSWHKKITVTVTSDYMKDTIRQSSIFSYWNFR